MVLGSSADSPDAFFHVPSSEEVSYEGRLKIAEV